jgi:hypothetical protein
MCLPVSPCPDVCLQSFDELPHLQVLKELFTQVGSTMAECMEDWGKREKKRGNYLKRC